MHIQALLHLDVGTSEVLKDFCCKLVSIKSPGWGGTTAPLHPSPSLQHPVIEYGNLYEHKSTDHWEGDNVRTRTHSGDNINKNNYCLSPLQWCGMRQCDTRQPTPLHTSYHTGMEPHPKAPRATRHVPPYSVIFHHTAALCPGKSSHKLSPHCTCSVLHGGNRLFSTSGRKDLNGLHRPRLPFKCCQGVKGQPQVTFHTTMAHWMYATQRITYDKPEDQELLLTLHTSSTNYISPIPHNPLRA